MNETDLSDEAFWRWDKDINRLSMDKSFSEHALDGWQECRRRAQILLAEALAEKKRHDDMYEKEITSRDEEIEKLSAEIDKERREAFDFAFDRMIIAAGLEKSDPDLLENKRRQLYRAFLQERKN